jgi:phosphocarrier protein
MISHSHTIHDPAGLHARPAGLLVKCLQGFTCDVTLSRGEQTVNAKRLFSVMGLALKSGETMTLVATGADEAEAIEAAQGVLLAEGI